MRAMQFTQAKAQLSSVFDRVEKSGAMVVTREKSAPVAFVREDDLAELLARDFPFTTSMSRSKDGVVSIWLDEFAVYGRGEAIAEAVDDLLDEVEDYVDEWEQGLRDAPNHAERRWWVARVQLAADREALRDVLFPAPDAPDA